MIGLFDALEIRRTTFRNRIGISPMQQYCAAEDGKPTDWHMANLLPRALSGAALVFTEATAVTMEGRVCHGDLGLWNDSQVAAHARLANAIMRTGAVAGVQLGHAGRKGSRNPPWSHGPLDGGWTTIAPSAIAFGDYAEPRAMGQEEVSALPDIYAAAARRAGSAGYGIVEIHAAHGYLLHQFLSPLSNRREDRYGGDFEGRARVLVEVVQAVRASLPTETLLGLRLSHTDWASGGWSTEDTVRLAAALEKSGVDMLDISSGGLTPDQEIPVGPGYQVPGAAAVRAACRIAVASVGMITEATQAQDIVSQGKADLVLLARASMRDPHWPLNAAATLGAIDRLTYPPQFDRGWSIYGQAQLALPLVAPFSALG